MLATTRTKPPATSAHKYLKDPDVKNSKWKTRDKGETNVIICDKEILLTEELKIYLLYFACMTEKSICHALKSFSEIPIKEELC